MSAFKAVFVADIHLYSQFLGVSGRAYDLRSGSDQKCLAESGAVTDAAFEKIKRSGAGALVVVGDLTNDGEKCSHGEVIAKLNEINKSVPVYAVTSTHDWCSDSNARSYEGESVFTDVETASKEDLNEMYSGFGAENEISRFKTSAGFFSRSFRLSHGVRLILVNDDCDGKDGKSGYSPEHLAWAENQAKEGAAAGEFVIAAEHHLVMPCISPLVNSSQLISDGDTVAARLADAGVKLLFTGHSHMMRATRFVSPSGNSLVQVNLSALCGYPAGITTVTVDGGKAVVRTEYIEEFTYNDKKYTSEFFRTHAENVVMNVLNGALEGEKEFSERLSALGVKAKISGKTYKLIKKGVSFICSVSVGRAVHIVNALLPCGGRIRTRDIAVIKNEKLIKYIMPVFLSVFDGSRALAGCPDEVRRAVIALGAKISAYGKILPVKKGKKEKLQRLLSGVGQTLNELAEPELPVYREAEIS